ncbi:helix-turn-helix domain-containing protein [Lacticaseibacillus mingshuiensis]|uniref:helix-turn-helix domain-containing protein n=1 Tax=Lacticaseibacillus mingshuiensis TaxID=2799574 RepID=UPI0019416143|nr:helix-turn-helix domain-containing protein [Lacticaseibacillus mingshuiensis]
MHYTEVDNLIPVILAAQDGNDEAMSQLLDMFSYDFDREAAYGKSYIDPDIRQELQIKFVFSIQRFNVAEHLAQVPTPVNSRFCRK